MRRRLALTLSPVIVTLLWASVAMAAGGGHDGETHHASGAWLNLLFAGINFTLFVYLLRRFTRVPLSDFLGKRRKEMVEAMSKAVRAKEEADRIKTEYEAKAAALDETRQKLVDELRAIAVKDRDRMLAAAEAAGQRLREEAERTAQSDLERARRELRAEAARLAAELAARDIESRLTADDRRGLVHEFLEELAAR